MGHNDLGNLIDILQTGALIDQQSKINAQLEAIEEMSNKMANLEHEMKMSTDPAYRKMHIEQEKRTYGRKIQAEYNKFIAIYESEFKERVDKYEKEYNDKFSKLEKREAKEERRIKIGELFSQKRTKWNIFMLLANALVISGVLFSFLQLERSYQGAVDYYEPIIASNNTEINTLQLQNIELKDAIINQHNLANKLNNNYNQLNKEYMFLSGLYEESNNKITNNVVEITEYNQLIVSLNEKISQLENNIDTLNQVIIGLNLNIKTLNNDIVLIKGNVDTAFKIWRIPTTLNITSGLNQFELIFEDSFLLTVQGDNDRILPITEPGTGELRQISNTQIESIVRVTVRKRDTGNIFSHQTWYGDNANNYPSAIINDTFTVDNPAKSLRQHLQGRSVGDSGRLEARDLYVIWNMWRS